MSVGKVALALGALVIIALIIFATISNVVPATFEYFECAMDTFLNPSAATKLSGCSFEINFNSKGDGI